MGTRDWKNVGVIFAIILLLFQPVAGVYATAEVDNGMDRIKDQQQKAPESPISDTDKEKMKDVMRDAEKKMRILQSSGENEKGSLESFRKHYIKKEEGDRQLQSAKSVDLSEVSDRGVILHMEDGSRPNTSSHPIDLKDVPEHLEQQNIYLARVQDEADYNQVLKALKQDEGVLTAEPDYILETSYTPSDPYYNQQWHLPAINMERAWDVERGSADVTVAVLDSGVNAGHPDLQGRVLPGYDFVNEDSDPSDDHGHGTMVAGVIAANVNQTGSAGMDMHADILPVKVANDLGHVSSLDSVAGIYYAIEQGVDVINMSYGGYQFHKASRDALWEAYQQGILVIAAAGNDGISDPSYPASYEFVISVAATNEAGNPASFSNFGNMIDIAAPGTNIISPNHLNTYSSANGTSFSAPVVSGVASLLKARNPGWEPWEIEWALESEAVPTGQAEWENRKGYGRVDAYESLTASLPSLSGDVSNERSGARQLNSGEAVTELMDMPQDTDWYSFDIGQTASVTLDLTVEANHQDLVGVVYKYNGDTVTDQQVIDDGAMGDSEQLTFTTDPGTYYLAVYDYNNHWSETPYKVQADIDTSISEEDYDIWEVEPNDQVADATTLPYEMIGAGAFQTADDLDIYEVELPYWGDILLSAAADSNAVRNDPSAILLDEDGNVIHESQVYQEVDNDLKINSVSYDNIEPGTYYIVAANMQNYAVDRPYLIDISYIGEVYGEVAIPQASLESGTYTGDIEVELTAEDGTNVIYTLDGTEPGPQNGRQYTGPITMKEDTTLKAVAVVDGRISKTAEFNYIIEQVNLAPPTANISSGEEFNEPFELELTSNLPDANIIYTVDGTEPTPSHGVLYEGPITIEETTEVKAISVLGSMVSDVSSFIYYYVPAAEEPVTEEPEEPSPSEPEEPVAEEPEEPAPNVPAEPVITKFPDVNRYEQEIGYLAGLGIIRGYRDGTFRPEQNVNRLQAVQMILQEMDIDVENYDAPDPGFTDVRPGSYGYEYIAAAVEIGFIKGKQNNTFDKGGSLTRGQMAAILTNAYNLEAQGTVNFTDVHQGHWAYDVVNALVSNGIARGYTDNTFRPGTPVSRQHFSVFLYNYLQ
ncbi:S8 family serine peptidase [Virgibacillus sediminis]|uniref:S8 family serine peptidase n=1 Tax=Virgibacillus sediminis TaxID=202260 RepID=A0ABV7A3V8_9BACI